MVRLLLVGEVLYFLLYCIVLYYVLHLSLLALSYYLSFCALSFGGVMGVLFCRKKNSREESFFWGRGLLGLLGGVFFLFCCW